MTFWCKSMGRSSYDAFLWVIQHWAFSVLNLSSHHYWILLSYYWIIKLNKTDLNWTELKYTDLRAEGAKVGVFQFTPTFYMKLGWSKMVLVGIVSTKFHNVDQIMQIMQFMLIMHILQILQIIQTKFHNFDQILQFWPDLQFSPAFTILTKFHKYDKISQFWPNF